MRAYTRAIFTRVECQKHRYCVNEGNLPYCTRDMESDDDWETGFANKIGKQC